ncbi:MAG: FliI/YscN family ATPase [Bacteriovoracia bacterium]
MSKLILYRETGKLSRSIGLVFEGYLPGATLGSMVQISQGSNSIEAEVVGFKDKKVMLMPLNDAHGLGSSSRIFLSQIEATIPVGDFLLGRVIDGKGIPIDEKGDLLGGKKTSDRRGIYATSINPLEREMISKPLDLGIRALNGLLTCGKGQRMGIMAGSGVGKSVLLGMMAKNTNADVNVIALIGERGREVREFIEKDLGPEGLARSVLVVATSDKSPLLRMRGAFIATAIAEYFCEQGKDVLLMMDSITRFAMAQREIGLSLGEPPASKGYTPSVFSMLPKLLERAGTRKGAGSITGLYTVLVEGDDMDEPIADSARSILDGHIVLSRALANRNHYPAIDVLSSVSRVMPAVTSLDQQRVAAEVKDLLATYAANEDLINIGAYVKGSNSKLDQAIAVNERLRIYLKQAVDEKANLQESFLQLQGLMRSLKGAG